MVCASTFLKGKLHTNIQTFHLGDFSMGKSHTGIHWFSQNQWVPVCFLPSVCNWETYRNWLNFKMLEKLKNSEFLYKSSINYILQKCTGIDWISNWLNCRVTWNPANSCIFLTLTLRVRNLQELTVFQKITLLLPKKLVRNIQELAYFQILVLLVNEPMF